MNPPHKILLEALGSNAGLLSLSIEKNGLQDIEKKLNPLLKGIEQKQDLLIIGHYLNLISIKGDYHHFNAVRKRVSSAEVDYNRLAQLIEPTYNIKSIRIDYIDSKKRFGTWIISDPLVLQNIKFALRKGIVFRKKAQKKKIPVKSHKPYGSFLKHWVKALNEYLKDKIVTPGDKYIFIGRFLKLTGMPLRNLQKPHEGREVSETNYFDHIRKTYL